MPKETRRWLFALQSVLIVAVAVLSLMLSWVIYGQHPLLAIASAVVAVLLLVLRLVGFLRGWD